MIILKYNILGSAINISWVVDVKGSNIHYAWKEISIYIYIYIYNKILWIIMHQSKTLWCVFGIQWSEVKLQADLINTNSKVHVKCRIRLHLFVSWKNSAVVDLESIEMINYMASEK